MFHDMFIYSFMKMFTSLNENQANMPAKVDITALPEFAELVKKYNLSIISSDLQKARGVVKFERPSEGPYTGGKRMYVLYPNGTIRTEYPKGTWLTNAQGRYPDGSKAVNSQTIIDQVGPIETEDDARKMIARVDQAMERSEKRDKNAAAKKQSESKLGEIFKLVEDQIVLSIYHKRLGRPDADLYLLIADEFPEMDQEDVAEITDNYFTKVLAKLKY